MSPTTVKYETRRQINAGSIHAALHDNFRGKVYNSNPCTLEYKIPTQKQLEAHLIRPAAQISGADG